MTDPSEGRCKVCGQPGFVRINQTGAILCRKCFYEPIKRTAPKIGRNRACPCGSGKKSKQCCAKGR